MAVVGLVVGACVVEVAPVAGIGLLVAADIGTGVGRDIARGARAVDGVPEEERLRRVGRTDEAAGAQPVLGVGEAVDECGRNAARVRSAVPGCKVAVNLEAGDSAGLQARGGDDRRGGGESAVLQCERQDKEHGPEEREAPPGSRAQRGEESPRHRVASISPWWSCDEDRLQEMPSGTGLDTEAPAVP